MRRLLMIAALSATACVIGSTGEAQASSHREAPFVTKNPKVDSSDFYMFRSYETGKENTVTIIANYLPLQDPNGGPNYFQLDPEALYEIHVDQDGDGAEDLTFQFQFKNTLAAANATIPVTLDGTTVNNDVSVLNIGGVSFEDQSKLQVLETFTMNVVKGDRRTGASEVATGSPFRKPLDFTGTATFGGGPLAGTTDITKYETYASKHIQTFGYTGCTGARVFAGQRREGFAARIGPIFDLVQGGVSADGTTGATGFAGAITNGGSTTGRGRNVSNPFDTGELYNKNVTSIAIEVPITCLTKDADHPIIGGWTSASLRQARVLNPNANYDLPAKEGGAWTQVSRLGMPLVNEAVIGYKDKDTFNALGPKIDPTTPVGGIVAGYVTNPTLPTIIELLYGGAGAKAPIHTRTDLVGIYGTGLTVTLADNTQLNLNQTSTGPGNAGPTGNALPAAIAEYVRLNTADGPGGLLLPRTKTQQNAMQDSVKGLGALGCFDPTAGTGAKKVVATDPTLCDPTGFPNGRRPGDDVLDITLRAAMGAVYASDTDAPARNVPFTDGNYNAAEQFDAAFPYLRTPVPGNLVGNNLQQK